MYINSFIYFTNEVPLCMTESKSNLHNCYKIDYWFAKVVGMWYVYSFHTLEEINIYTWYFDQKKKKSKEYKSILYS